MSNRMCAVNKCGKEAIGKFFTPHSRRFKVWFCEEHKPNGVIQVEEFKPATSGDMECDRAINQAVDVALLRLSPIIRDIIREELRRNLEAVIDDTKKAS